MLVQASREDLTGPDGAPPLTDIRIKTDISQRKRHAEQPCSAAAPDALPCSDCCSKFRRNPLTSVAPSCSWLNRKQLNQQRVVADKLSRTRSTPSPSPPRFPPLVPKCSHLKQSRILSLSSSSFALCSSLRLLGSLLTPALSLSACNFPHSAAVSEEAALFPPTQSLCTDGKLKAIEANCCQQRRSECLCKSSPSSRWPGPFTPLCVSPRVPPRKLLPLPVAPLLHFCTPPSPRTPPTPRLLGHHLFFPSVRSQFSLFHRPFRVFF